jgi:hypothetical protein
MKADIRAGTGLAATQRLLGVPSMYHLLVMVLAVFWLMQVIDLIFSDLRFFESHTHKLTWFLVLIAGNLVGAIWYHVWKKAAIAARSVPGKR